MRKQAQICECEKCGNRWLPADPDNLPKRCGKCKSPAWNASGEVEASLLKEGPGVPGAEEQTSLLKANAELLTELEECKGEVERLSGVVSDLGIKLDETETALKRAHRVEPGEGEEVSSFNSASRAQRKAEREERKRSMAAGVGPLARTLVEKPCDHGFRRDLCWSEVCRRKAAGVKA